MTKHRIAVIAGDGIGREVMPEGLRALDAAARKFGIDLHFDMFDFSSWAYYEKHGKMLPDNWKDQIGGHDAIYFGAVGWPDKIPDHISLWGSLLLFRREFDQYINLRPARLMPGIVAPVVRRDGSPRQPGEIDMYIVRENTEGEYSSIGGRMFEGTAREILRAGLNFPLHPMADMLFNPLAKPGDADYGNLYISVGDGTSGERAGPTHPIPQRLDALLDATDDAVLRVLPDLTIRAASPACKEILAREVEDLRGVVAGRQVCRVVEPLAVAAGMRRDNHHRRARPAQGRRFTPHRGRQRRHLQAAHIQRQRGAQRADQRTGNGAVVARKQNRAQMLGIGVDRIAEEQQLDQRNADDHAERRPVTDRKSVV